MGKKWQKNYIKTQNKNNRYQYRTILRKTEDIYLPRRVSQYKIFVRVQHVR